MICNNRLLDRQPQSITQCVYPSPQIEGSIKVSVAGVSTVQTLEKTCFLRSYSVDFIASFACFGTVMRSNCNENGFLFNSFIFYETSQLVESPVGKQPVNCPSSSSVSYSLQVFHNNNISCIYFADNTYTDFMIDTPHKPFLSAFKLFEMLLGRLGAFGLEFTPQSLKFCNLAFNSFKKLFFRSCGKIVYPKINPYDFVIRSTNTRIDFLDNSNIQEYFFPGFGKSGASDVPIFIGLKIVIRNIENLFDSAIDSGKRALTGPVKRIGTFIILNGQFFGKINLSVFASSLGFNGKFDCFATKLGRKLRELSYLFVGSLMQNLPRVYFVLPSIVIGKLNGLAELYHRFYKIIGTRNFDAYSSFGHHSDHRRSSLQTSFLSFSGVHFRSDSLLNLTHSAVGKSLLINNWKETVASPPYEVPLDLHSSWTPKGAGFVI